MQRSTIFLFILALFVGFTLFKVKYEVVEIEQQLAQILRQIDKEKENIHILNAEWSHLNEPKRLQYLAEKYLDIRPIKAEQLAGIAPGSAREGAYYDERPRPHLTSMKGLE